MALDFNKFAAKGNEFMNELAKELGYPDDRSKAGRVLKSVLHALRNHLTIEESVQMLAQLPMFLKAVYVENWSTHKDKKRVKHLEGFYKEIDFLNKRNTVNDFKDEDEIASAVSVIFIVLRRYISLGELEDMKAVLPKELKTILNTVIMV